MELLDRFSRIRSLDSIKAEDGTISFDPVTGLTGSAWPWQRYRGEISEDEHNGLQVRVYDKAAGSYLSGIQELYGKYYFFNEDSGLLESRLAGQLSPVDAQPESHGLLSAYETLHGLSSLKAEDGTVVFDPLSGQEGEKWPQQDYAVEMSRNATSGKLDIKVRNLESGKYLRGVQTLYGRQYCFQDKTNLMVTGFDEEPYRGQDKTETHYYIEAEGPDYGTRQYGRLSSGPGTHQEYFFNQSSGALVRDDFYMSDEGLVCTDQDGCIRTGFFERNGSVYWASQKGIVQGKDGQDILPLYTEDKESKTVTLRVRDDQISAPEESVTASILKEAEEPAEKCRYTSMGRNNPARLDCLGFASYIYNQVFGQELQPPSCNDFMQDKDAGTIISETGAMPGDFVMYRSTFSPNKNIYTHTAIYLGDGLVLSMSNNGLSICAVDDIKDYYGNPAGYIYFRPAGSPNEEAESL